MFQSWLLLNSVFACLHWAHGAPGVRQVGHAASCDERSTRAGESLTAFGVDDKDLLDDPSVSLLQRTAGYLKRRHSQDAAQSPSLLHHVETVVHTSGAKANSSALHSRGTDHAESAVVEEQISGKNASLPTPAPFAPIRNGPPLQGVPISPPLKLAAEGNPPAGPLLAGGPMTNSTTGLYLRNKIISLTGRDVTVQNMTGAYVYATSGSFWTASSYTNMFDAQTGRRLAVITKDFWTIHNIYEIASYSPVCNTQAASGTDDNVPTYRFARLTRQFWSVAGHWALERYECNGSLSVVWIIEQSVLSALVGLQTHAIVKEPGTALPVGTIDQSYATWANGYTAWITKNEDLTLFAAAAIIFDFSDSGRSSAIIGRTGSLILALAFVLALRDGGDK